MFNISEWLIDGLKSGYRTGTIGFFKLTELTAAYLARGFISSDEAEALSRELKPNEAE